MELIDVRRGVAELIRSVERRYGISGAAEAGISTELLQAYTALRRAETAADRLRESEALEAELAKRPGWVSLNTRWAGSQTPATSPRIDSQAPTGTEQAPHPTDAATDAMNGRAGAE